MSTSQNRLPCRDAPIEPRAAVEAVLRQVEAACASRILWLEAEDRRVPLRLSEAEAAYLARGCRTGTRTASVPQPEVADEEDEPDISYDSLQCWLDNFFSRSADGAM